MLDLSNVRVEDELTHLFIPMSAMIEVSWLLRANGSFSDKCYIRSWRKVIKNQVPAIKHITEADRNAEIDKFYGQDAKYVKGTPAVIISNYNADDLFKALYNSLLGNDDEDYKRYDAELQAYASTEKELDEMDI